MPVDNYWHTLFSWSLIQTLWKYGKYELNKTSKVGRVAPNPPLVAGEKGQNVVRLLDLVKTPRPLVVVFGSCTCPVIIAKLEQMLDVQREFADIADFVMIYVQEAHPDDGWRMKVGWITNCFYARPAPKIIALFICPEKLRLLIEQSLIHEAKLSLLPLGLAFVLQILQ